jgi:hypothetical protein
MKYWQIKHTGWFNPKFLNQIWSTNKLGTKLLDEITLYVQLVCSSCSIPNFWIESSCLFNLSVLVWFKTFGWNHPVCWIWQFLMSGSTLGWNHPVCSTYQFFMSDSKLLDWIFLYVKNKQVEHTGWFNTKVLNHTWSTDKLNIQGDSIQNFWTRYEVDKLNIQGGWIWQYLMSGSTLGWNHPVCSTYQFFMSDSKLLDWIFLYVQFVSTSCLVQNVWMESPCIFNLSEDSI